MKFNDGDIVRVKVDDQYSDELIVDDHECVEGKYEYRLIRCSTLNSCGWFPEDELILVTEFYNIEDE